MVKFGYQAHHEQMEMEWDEALEAIVADPKLVGFLDLADEATWHELTGVSALSKCVSAQSRFIGAEQLMQLLAKWRWTKDTPLVQPRERLRALQEIKILWDFREWDKLPRSFYRNLRGVSLAYIMHWPAMGREALEILLREDPFQELAIVPESGRPALAALLSDPRLTLWQIFHPNKYRNLFSPEDFRWAELFVRLLYRSRTLIRTPAEICIFLYQLGILATYLPLMAPDTCYLLFRDLWAPLKGRASELGFVRHLLYLAQSIPELSDLLPEWGESMKPDFANLHAQLLLGGGSKSAYILALELIVCPTAFDNDRGWLADNPRIMEEVCLATLPYRSGNLCLMIDTADWGTQPWIGAFAWRIFDMTIEVLGPGGADIWKPVLDKFAAAIDSRLRDEVMRALHNEQLWFPALMAQTFQELSRTLSRIPTLEKGSRRPGLALRKRADDNSYDLDYVINQITGNYEAVLDHRLTVVQLDHTLIDMGGPIREVFSRLLLLVRDRLMDPNRPDRLCFGIDGAMGELVGVIAGKAFSLDINWPFGFHTELVDLLLTPDLEPAQCDAYFDRTYADQLQRWRRSLYLGGELPFDPSMLVLLEGDELQLQTLKQQCNYLEPWVNEPESMAKYANRPVQLLQHLPQGAPISLPLTPENLEQHYLAPLTRRIQENFCQFIFGFRKQFFNVFWAKAASCLSPAQKSMLYELFAEPALDAQELLDSLCFYGDDVMVQSPFQGGIVSMTTVFTLFLTSLDTEQLRKLLHMWTGTPYFNYSLRTLDIRFDHHSDKAEFCIANVTNLFSPKDAIIASEDIPRLVSGIIEKLRDSLGLDQTAELAPVPLTAALTTCSTCAETLIITPMDAVPFIYSLIVFINGDVDVMDDFQPRPPQPQSAGRGAMRFWSRMRAKLACLVPCVRERGEA